MQKQNSILLSRSASRLQRLASLFLNGSLFLITSLSLIAILFIIVFIARDALPFFRLRGVTEFFTHTAWYPSRQPADFGALAIFYGSAMVTLGATLIAAPIGVAAAVGLSDILPFSLRQLVKPVIEVLASIPSVAYGFFALVVLAPLLQQQGGRLLVVILWLVGLPSGTITLFILVEAAIRRLKENKADIARLILFSGGGVLLLWLLIQSSRALARITIPSGTNALNVALILGIMAIPTVISISEDALQAAGRELREGSYALGATRAETVWKVVIPAASSGIVAAVLLGVMRAVGETMVVWMASGNAAQIPSPFYNFLEPVRTLTATIAGDMGEADQVTGSARFHVLFAMALCLLLISLVANLGSEWIVRRSQKKLGRK